MPAKINGGEGITWPDNKRIAVMLTFDFDAECLQYSYFKTTDIPFADLSRGRYGPEEGLQRCLDVLAANRVKATFFVPGYVAEHYEQRVRGIVAAGHELGYHGYHHESVPGISREEELKNMEKAEALLTKLYGKKLLGHRGPNSLLYPFSINLIQERGYIYSSSMKTCDWAYIYEREGQKIPVVELPGDCTLDDYSYYFYSLRHPNRINLANDRLVREIWQDEFDGLAAEGDKILCLKLHPQLIGRASRSRMLSGLIAYMKDNGAWIATCEDVARYVLASNGITV